MNIGFGWSDHSLKPLSAGGSSSKWPAKLSRCILLCAVVFPAAAAQDASFSADVNLVTFVATVRDRAGRIITGLSREDFVLEEDGMPQIIRYFSRESSLPLTIGVLVDTCPWQLRVLEAERAASIAFVDRVLRGDSDKAFVLHFDRTVSLVQDFTSSRQKLGAALADLTTNPPGSRGGCHFRDGIQTASELMKRQTGRKAFILLSAGMERGSKISGEAAIEYAQRSDIIVYSIPFQGPTWPRLFVAVNAMGAKYKALGRQTLQQLALETGGGYFPVTPDKPLNEIYGQIEEELRSQYGIGYTPVQTKNNRTYRKLRLTTKNGDLVVQSRAGYYPK